MIRRLLLCFVVHKLFHLHMPCILLGRMLHGLHTLLLLAGLTFRCPRCLLRSSNPCGDPPLLLDGRPRGFKQLAPLLGCFLDSSPGSLDLDKSCTLRLGCLLDHSLGEVAPVFALFAVHFPCSLDSVQLALRGLSQLPLCGQGNCVVCTFLFHLGQQPLVIGSHLCHPPLGIVHLLLRLHPGLVQGAVEGADLSFSSRSISFGSVFAGHRIAHLCVRLHSSLISVALQCQRFRDALISSSLSITSPLC
mmetsp:Transcript_2355/g.5217  ORF Transcript_2355/g.5217 Transcript_2355/m.5217 type:complete len:248 (+) Transcript_2355:594-1337(+)